MSKIEVYRSDIPHDWRWRLKAGNGEIIGSGEGYKTRAGAVRGAKAMQRAAATAKWQIQSAMPVPSGRLNLPAT